MPIPVKISGSRAASVLGQNPWQTPVQVWLQIQEEINPGFCAENGYILPVFEGNAATRFGSAFESAIINLTEKKFGQQITDRERFYERDYLSCHIDGIMGDDTLIENKTTALYSYRDEWGPEGTDRIPVNYQIQIAHNLFLSGLDRCILPVLIFPRRQQEMEDEGITTDVINVDAWAATLMEMGLLKYYEIRANILLQAEMLNRYETWWTDYVIGRTPPEPRSYDDIKALCPAPSGTIICDEDTERLASEYRNITQEIGASGALAKRKDQIRVELLRRMRDTEKTLDDDSDKKWIMRNMAGKKLFQFDGKVMR